MKFSKIISKLLDLVGFRVALEVEVLGEGEQEKDEFVYTCRFISKSYTLFGFILYKSYKWNGKF